MSSMMSPPMPPKAASYNKPKSKPSGKSKTRRVKSGTAPTGKDVTHVVRVTVLGLAGITVDRSKCRYSSKDEELPASPSKMRAVVAFSRNSVIQGTTRLSKPLTRSPNDDVVVATNETNEEVASVAKSGEVLQAAPTETKEETTPDSNRARGDDERATGGDDEATHETKSTKGSLQPPPRRHLAVWVSDDGLLGSTVTFEANLHRSDRGGKKFTAASSAFTPKSFDLTIGLTEGSNRDQTAIALPLGVATLTVSGEQFTTDQNATVDLPVWNLSQARPLETSDGTGQYPLITLAPASESSMDGISLKKKRTGLQRLFAKKDKNGNIAFPSSAEREAFSSAYSMDSAGDAILRVSLEVYRKDSAGDSTTKDAPIQNVNDQKNRRKVSKRPGSPVVRRQEVAGSFDEETYDSEEGSAFTDESYNTDDGTDFTGSLITTEDETITLDDSIVTNEDNRMVFFSWVNRPGQTRYSSRRGQGKRSDRSKFSFLQETEGQLSINILGRQVSLPACKRTDSEDSREDMTHITADFFGETYQVPLCRGIAKKEEDDDSATTYTYTEHTSTSGTRMMEMMTGGFCQSNGLDDDIKIVSTFSTLSENPRLRRDTWSKKVVVVNTQKVDDDGESISSEDAENLRIPDEPSEVDDIMRIVRSKHAQPFQKALVVQKANLSLDEKKNSTTDESPKGVEEFVEIKADEESNSRSRILQGLADMIQCQYPIGHNGQQFEPFQPQIPPVVIQSEADAISVGELTATTLERNIEGTSEAHLLQRARRMLDESRTLQNEETESHKLMPIPLPSCGEGGICSPLKRRDTTSSPIRLGKEETVSIVEGQHTQAKDVTPPIGSDDCTTYTPIEVVKVSSEEKGSPFSRVRSPSADRRKTEKAMDCLYSESLPVYASMKDDGSESLVGAFVESKGGERELFNPITGQEVDQAFL